MSQWHGKMEIVVMGYLLPSQRWKELRFQNINETFDIITAIISVK
jgi:hypothetical protein